MQADYPIFWRTCNSQGQCHCDWRLTIYECAETDAIKWIYIINAIASFVGGAIGICLLYYRIVYRDQHIFDTNTQTGFIRPRPIESMILFAVIFSFLRLVHSIILVTDVLSSVTFRSFAFEFPWIFGYAALSSYVFGIAHTMSENSHVIYNAWFHDPLRIDILFSLMIILPIVSNNICSISAGVYAQQGDLKRARLYTHALYYLWTVYAGTLSMILLYSGVRLVSQLQHHLRQQHQVDGVEVKIKTGILKVKLVIFIGFICLSVFAIILFLYANFRESMENHSVASLLIAGIWTFDGPLATLLVELALILNPHMTSVLGLVTVSSSILASMKDGTSSWADDQQYSLSLSPTNKSTFSSYDGSIKFSSLPSKNYLYSHQLQLQGKTVHGNKTISIVNDPHSSPTDGTSANYTPLSLSPLTTTISNTKIHRDSFETRQIELDQLQYNAVTSQARIHYPRALSHQKKLNTLDVSLSLPSPSIPPPFASDHLFATYY